jgi:octaheme c-type cytochrome (tetrathionate reductase family)
MKSRHWTWLSDIENLATSDDAAATTPQKRVGKGGDVINNFCLSVSSNEPRCTSCHAGYGWKDKSFDFTDESRVDCLVCHEQTGKYKKFPVDAGHPNYVPKEWPKGSGKIRPVVDLAEVAQSVALPGRQNCGTCHFNGGGGEAVKHGDMDSSLVHPDVAVDVHMAKDGGDFSCTECHTTIDHMIAEPNVTLPARDKHEFRMMGASGSNLSCEACHTQRPHTLDPKKGHDPQRETFFADKLDDHTDKVACQTCHIPTMSKQHPTKQWWDWSKAGKKDEKGKPLNTSTEVKGFEVHDYMGKKGEFIWSVAETPEYYWFNGSADQAFIGDTVDLTTPGKETTRRSRGGQFDRLDMDLPVVPINRLHGDYDDPNARIYPFKVHRGKQGVDPIQKKLLVPRLFGSKEAGAYWKNYSWDLAFQAGMAYVDEVWSGKYDWVQTEMYWPVTHMVQPKEEALTCIACHSGDGVLAELDGFYMPGRDSSKLLDRIGWAAILLSAAGVLVHGLLRMVLKPKV